MLGSQAGQSAQDKQMALQQAIQAHYRQLFEQAEAKRAELGVHLPIVATGHLTTVGASASESVREIYVDDKVRRYLMQIVHDTRTHDDVSLGGSPRASIALFRTSQAMAAMRGRNYVLPDDVKRIAGPVLVHRMILKPESRLRKVTAGAIVDEIIAEIAVPTLEERAAG